MSHLHPVTSMMDLRDCGELAACQYDDKAGGGGQYEAIGCGGRTRAIAGGETTASGAFTGA